MSVLLGGQVEMQHNPQMFCSFDIYHEITEQAGLPGTVLGQRTFEKNSYREAISGTAGRGGNQTQYSLTDGNRCGEKNPMTRK